jgi:hypothetical protein
VTIQDLGSIGELVAAIATVATLGYLAIQIRQNTRALRGTSHEASVSRVQGWQLAIATDPVLSSIYQRVSQGAELSEEEEARFSLLVNYALLGTEVAYYQQLRGNADPEMWQAQLARLRLMFRLPGFRGYWQDENRLPLTEPFERFVNQELQGTEQDR